MLWGGSAFRHQRPKIESRPRHNDKIILPSSARNIQLIINTIAVSFQPIQDRGESAEEEGEGISHRRGEDFQPLKVFILRNLPLFLLFFFVFFVCFTHFEKCIALYNFRAATSSTQGLAK